MSNLEKTKAPQKPKRMLNRKKQLPDIRLLIHEANRIFLYDRIHGQLIWKAYANPKHPGKTKLGRCVGGDDGHGYLMCILLGHKFKVHQMIWLMHYGELPDSPIDHINHNRRDNRIENLRLVNDLQNQGNQKPCARKYAGVKKDRKGKGFSANIGYKNKRIYLGYFQSKDEAYNAYVEASRRMRGKYSPV